MLAGLLIDEHNLTDGSAKSGAVVRERFTAAAGLPRYSD
jgi:hypothetical protein